MVWGTRAVVVGVALFGLWFIFLGPGKKENGTAGLEPGNSKVAPSVQTAKPKPWSGGGARSDPASMVSGIQAPQTPVLDEWMDKNWNKPDDSLIDGLLRFAQDTSISVVERHGATRHTLNLLSENDIGKLTPLIDNPSTPVPVLEEVLANLHNRGEFAAITAGLRLLRRSEPDISLEAKKLLAFLLDMDEQNENEAIRLQAETRLIELVEAPAPEPHQEIPAGTVPDDAGAAGSSP